MHYNGSWDMTLANELDKDVPVISTSVVICDIGFGLFLPRDIAHRLRLDVRSTEEIVAFDGQSITADIVGPVRVTVENRSGLLSAAVYGDETRIVKIAISGFDQIRNR
jgi:hypothetical protein